MELNKRRILLGVTGGVAAYKAAELLRELQRRGADVQVVMTASATRFVGPVTFQALSGNPVFTDAWDNRIDNNMAHIELSRDADLILIAPASADFMAKMANGLCDDLLSTLVVARNKPIAIAPAMNVEMWTNPATQRNAQTLRDDGVALIGPAAGDQACGETGLGRMVEPVDIAEAVCAHFVPNSLVGKQVLITAGPTYEAIDPVRGITNRSSGKMGFAIARACQQAGATVRLVAGPVALSTPVGVERHDVRSARQMYDAVIAACQSPTDVFIAVAAVADWAVANPSDQKIKKTSKTKTPSLAFTENPDILASVAKLSSPPYCVGFAAESEDLLKNGQAKRKRKGVPMLVANIGPDTFGQDDNELLIIDESGHQKIPRASKESLARHLVTEIAGRLSTARTTTTTSKPATKKTPLKSGEK
ncbi:MAG: bifunctional phosphopantothenoylcysteine decarboxylase/phosphopantothenate--cysteine ligase CoaBC [Burkholderiaceae bacterium]